MGPEALTITPDATASEVSRILRAESILQLPVVDDAGRPVGLHVLQSYLDAHSDPGIATTDE